MAIGTTAGGGGGATLPLTGTGATITASAPLLNLSQTWNNAGVTFTGIKLNVTNTASAVASLLLDLQTGGASQFSVSQAGTVAAAGPVNITSASASALAVGLTGATNPAFSVDASTGSQAAGLNVLGGTTSGAVAVRILSSGTNNNLTIDAKGSGTLTLNGTATGGITLGRATTITTGNLTISSGQLSISGGNVLLLNNGTSGAVANAIFFGAAVGSGQSASTLGFAGNTGAATTGPLVTILGAGGGSGASTGGELRLQGGLTSAAGGAGGAVTIYTAPAAAGNTPAVVATFANDKSVTLAGTLATAAPAGSSSGLWKLGALQTGVVVVDTSRSIFVDIGGTVYKLIVAQ